MNKGRTSAGRFVLCSLLALLVSLITVALGGRAEADDPSDRAAAHCAIIESSLERLQCFDDWARARGFSVPGFHRLADRSGKWNVSEEKSQIDDTVIVQFELESDTGQSKFGQKPVLAIRCNVKETYVAIYWHDYLGMERTDVTTRVDKNKAATASWRISNTGEVMLMPELASFVRNMLDATQLVAEVVPYSDPRITAVFDITGMRAAITPHADVCKPLKL
jgi:type VI secretion system protein VasI